MNGFPSLRSSNIDMLDRPDAASEKGMQRETKSRDKLARILLVTAIGALSLYLMWRAFPLVPAR